MFESIIACIKEFDIITIYAHQNADGDALGSSFGLKTLLKHVFVDKQVYALGKNTVDNGKFFPMFDDISDELIKKSLAIVVDTGNVARIDEQRYILAKKMLKIDHHPNVEPYGDLMIVEENSSSTCELIMKLGQELVGEKPFIKEVATYLYAGLSTDTMGFTTTSTTYNSLEAGAFLARSGLNLNDISAYFTSKSADMYNFVTKLRSKLIINGALAYCKVEKEVYEDSHIPFEEAKNCVSEFGKIEGLKVWCLFTEIDDSHDKFKYQGSLRSRGVIVNDIAANFNGGGHKVAAGVKLASLEEMEALLKALSKRVEE